MFNAKEAKTISRVNKRKIETKQLERIINDVENRILGAIHCGYGYIAINSELSYLSEVLKHFDALGYETIIVNVGDNEKKTYIIWDKEVWIKETGFEERGK